MVVFGADFVYSVGTIFVAKIVLPHEQSLAGGLFQTMTQVRAGNICLFMSTKMLTRTHALQIGTAFGLTVSTIVFNSAVDTEAAKLGVSVNSSPAQLQGYRTAQWTAAAFPFLGK